MMYFLSTYRKMLNVLIDKEKLMKNIRIICNKVNKKHMIAVLKDNAYGHGIDKIAEYLIEAGINLYAVGTIDEAIKLRKLSENIKILILKRVEDEELKVAIHNNISITIDSIEYLKKLLKYEKSTKEKITAHIKFDVGLHRWGIEYSEGIIKQIANMLRNSSILIDGVFTQLRDTYFSLNDNKCEKVYMEIRKQCMEEIKGVKYFHFRTTPAVNSEIYKWEYLRVGAGLYGIPNNRKGILKQLNRVMKISTTVKTVKKLKKGETLGYTPSEFVANTNIKIAIIPTGYADGVEWDSCLYINNKKIEILAIFLDSMIVKIDETVKEGMKVEVDSYIGYRKNKALSQITCHYGNIVTNRVIYLEEKDLVEYEEK